MLAPLKAGIFVKHCCTMSTYVAHSRHSINISKTNKRGKGDWKIGREKREEEESEERKKKKRVSQCS